MAAQQGPCVCYGRGVGGVGWGAELSHQGDVGFGRGRRCPGAVWKQKAALRRVWRVAAVNGHLTLRLLGGGWEPRGGGGSVF